MMSLIQLLTDQWAYEGITHSQWGASWNWRWRRVGDGEERRHPSPEPQTDSRSGLPVKNRRWRWLRLVERDNSFSLIFSGNMWFYSVGFRVCGATRWGQPTWARQERGARPGGLCPPRCPSPVNICYQRRDILILKKTEIIKTFKYINRLIFYGSNVQKLNFSYMHTW